MIMFVSSSLLILVLFLSSYENCFNQVSLNKKNADHLLHLHINGEFIYKTSCLLRAYFYVYTCVTISSILFHM